MSRRAAQRDDWGMSGAGGEGRQGGVDRPSVPTLPPWRERGRSLALRQAAPGIPSLYR